MIRGRLSGGLRHLREKRKEKNVVFLGKYPQLVGETRKGSHQMWLKKIGYKDEKEIKGSFYFSEMSSTFLNRERMKNTLHVISSDLTLTSDFPSFDPGLYRYISVIYKHPCTSMYMMICLIILTFVSVCLLIVSCLIHLLPVDLSLFLLKRLLEDDAKRKSYRID